MATLHLPTVDLSAVRAAMVRCNVSGAAEYVTTTGTDKPIGVRVSNIPTGHGALILGQALAVSGFSVSC